MKKLAIAIPNYNGGMTIGENLTQILRIMPENVELVISDNTEKICKHILNEHSSGDRTAHYRNEESGSVCY